MSFFRRFLRLGEGLWFIPLSCVLAGVGLSFGMIAIDQAYNYELVPRSISGEPDAAIEVLGTIAASMVSLAALVLTITMVVVQLAMGQFSPRIVQRILRDKPSQLAIGVFVGTFAHSMLTLREVQTDGEGVVPGLAVLVAFVLIVISIIILVWYVDHIGRALRVSALIELVGKDTRKLLDNIYTDPGAAESDRSTIPAPHSGVITRIDHDALVGVAERADCVLKLRPALGEFVPAGAPLFDISGPAERIDPKAVARLLEVSLERTLEHDMAYGLRLLVDIAERSLSDGPFQDPTTAVQAIDRLHDCLRQLAPRPFPDGQHRDRAAVVRLVTHPMSWEDYVHLAFDEIRMAGAKSPQIRRRLRAALEDLLAVAPPERKPPLREQLNLLEAEVENSTRDAQAWKDRRKGDARGLG